MLAKPVVPPLFCCHTKLNAVVGLVPSGSTIDAEDAVKALPCVGVVSLIVGPAVGAELATTFPVKVIAISLTAVFVVNASSAVLAPTTAPGVKVTENVQLAPGTTVVQLLVCVKLAALAPRM